MKGDIVLFRINNNTISANIKDVNSSSPDENGTNAAKIANYLEKNSYKIETDKNKNLIIKKEDEED